MVRVRWEHALRQESTARHVPPTGGHDAYFEVGLWD